MGVRELTAGVMLFTGGTMTIVYTVILRHNYKGMKNKWMYLVLLLLLLSQIFLVTLSYGYW